MVPAIETDGLTKRYGEDVLAVDDLDLTVESGEVFGFLGPNGAGKSTTINLLLDFATPTEGSATVLGHDAAAEPTAIRERIGVLPEGYSVFDRLTGFEHLEYAIEMKSADDDPHAIVDRVGLDPEDADRPAGGYSKGMTQRLALGVALVGDPDLLILDEPSSGLDPTGMQEMRELIRAEAESGTTVFFSSHILGEVEAVCDRVGIMNDGRLVAVDEIDALRDAAGGGGTLRIELESVPEALDPTRVDGVVDATVEGDVVHVTCEDGRVKPAAIRYVDERATITDVLSDDTSLEELFNSYTGNGEESEEEAVPAEVPA